MKFIIALLILLFILADFFRWKSNDSK
ncbi:Protein of unknown function [Bacillus cereus]|nr:Protein of unknown function [Bacillus cereus]